MERIQELPFRLRLTVAVRAAPVVSCGSKQSIREKRGCGLHRVHM